jgi:hypothetical protein
MNHGPRNRLPDDNGDGITGTFTDTIAMVRADNGWRAAR